MQTDDDLLAHVPDFLSINTLMKARPSTEGEDRIVYFEASNEARDQQGEIILSKALQESANYFLRFGLIDLDHKSMPSVAKGYGIENPEEWAIGQPVDVKFERGTTFVKAKLYRGDTPLAERANNVWDGLTKLSPPARYYASVGGQVLERDVRIDPKTKERVPVVTKVRWNNLAATVTPVNPDLSVASTVPVGTFAKSLGGFVFAKGIEAGYGTDSAALAGGAAMRKQSLDSGRIYSYFDFRNKLSKVLTDGSLKNPGAREILDRASKEFGLPLDQTAEWVERFMRDLRSGLNKRRKQ